VRDKRDPATRDIVPVRGVSGPVPLHRLAAQAWTALVAAARADGIAEPLLLPVSGYRSGEHQQRLWAAALARYGSPEVARRWVAPPGGSAHQSGRAIDFHLGGRNDSANVGRLRTLPAYRWLAANAQRFGFYPYEAEPWHWEYNPPAGAAGGAPPPAVASPRAAAGVRAGRVEVPSVPALAGHRGRRPALVLRWNDMAAAPDAIDVVVHLHGFSRTGLTLPSDIEPVSGLDLRARTRPALAILPRGDDTGVKQTHGRRFVYTFPALDGSNGRRDGLSRLIAFSLQRFAQATGAAPRAGRLILTAHSGGGPPLLRMLRFADPDEVHVFDALYAPADALASWARRHIVRDRGGAREPGALRVFYRRDSGTALHSRRLRAALGVPPGALARRYRVELSTLDHMEIPRAYGGRMLADASADVPQASAEPRR
jgi:hypothetical protein